MNLMVAHERTNRTHLVQLRHVNGIGTTKKIMATINTTSLVVDTDKKKFACVV
jgi:hypothetical protein